MRHLARPEKLIEPRPPHNGCKGFRQGVGVLGEALGGCPFCWSKTTWRWNCSACSYRTAWVEENVAANEEMQAFHRHDVMADGAAAGPMSMFWED